MLSKKLLKVLTLLIILILFYASFTVAFGNENSIVGVFIILLSIFMLDRDLSRRPFRNLFIVTSINVILAIGALISYHAPILGFFIIFFIVFLVTYIVTHSLENPIYYPMILGFLLLLSKPVTVDDIGLRILSLVVGSVFIVGLNILVNRNKFSKSIRHSLVTILEDIEKMVEYRIQNKKIDETEIDKNLALIRSQIDTSLSEDHFSKPIYTAILNVTASLEQIEILLLEEDFTKKELNKLKELIGKLIKVIDNISLVKSILNEFIKDNPDFKPVFLYSLKVISYELGNPNDDKYDITKIPSRFQLLSVLKEDFSINSIKFTFALKLAISISVVEFIGYYFNIPNINWVGYTILAILQPCLDNTVKKARLRVRGTIVGILVFVIIDNLFLLKTDILYFSFAPTLIVFICVLGFAYVLTSLHRYDVQMIFITVMSLLIAESAATVDATLTERFVYIIVGCVIALLMNYKVLPKTIKQQNIRLLERYHRFNKIEINNIKLALLNKLNFTENTILVLKSNSIQESVAQSNSDNKDDRIAEILKMETLITSISSFLINLVQSNSVSKKTEQSALNYIEKSEYTDVMYVKLLKEINDLESKTEKLLSEL